MSLELPWSRPVAENCSYSLTGSDRNSVLFQLKLGKQGEMIRGKGPIHMVVNDA